MTPSPEYLALQAKRRPARSTTGDMWLCRRLGIVRVFNGHKRGTRRGEIHNCFHLYHWGKPSMWAASCNWRDNDPNAGMHDPALSDAGENWEYIGNMFAMLPYEALSSRAEFGVGTEKENSNGL